jgi:insulysin
MMMSEFFVTHHGDRVQASALFKEMWAEKQALGDVQFRFLEDSASNPLSDVFHLSHNINTYPPDEVLSADFVYKTFDGKLIYNYLARLINPSNILILIGDSEYKYTENEEISEIQSEQLRN